MRSCFFQSAEVSGEVALRTSCVHVIEVAVPTTSLNASQQRITGLNVGKAPNAQEAMFGALV